MTVRTESSTATQNGVQIQTPPSAVFGPLSFSKSFHVGGRNVVPWLTFGLHG